MRGDKNESAENPVSRYFEFSSPNKTFKYWDAEKKENVMVDLPFTFIGLDQRTAIGGFNPNENRGNNSNEIQYQDSERLTVWCNGKKMIDNKLYEEFSKEMASFGGKFQKNVYIAYKEGKEYKIGVINFISSGVGAWIEFLKEGNTTSKKGDFNQGIAIQVKEVKENKKMGKTYNTPVFSIVKTSDTAEKAVMELVPGLSKYFEDRSSKAKVATTNAVEETISETLEAKKEEGDDLPF